MSTGGDSPVTMTAPDSTTDRIALTVPATPGLRAVVTLVLGGIGTRLDLPYERVDDLQLAVLSVLAASELEQVTIDVEIDASNVEVNVGPLPGGGADDRGLRRVVERLVDGVESSVRESGDGGAEEWISLRLARPAYETA